MAALVSPNILRVGLLLAIVSAHIQWQHLVNTLVPAPYLDEVFHIPQAQAYWAGRWGYWDNKITTPPGLYVFSYGINFIRNVFSTEGVNSTTEDLRFSNAIFLVLLLVLMYAWTAAGRREVNDEAVMQREFAIVVFPLFFFFSVLYYTDLLGVVLVSAAYVAWIASCQAHGRAKVVYQALHLVTGLLALGARQTNVFWVAVFLGGLQVVETLRRSVGVDKIHDPPIAEAFFEDFLITSISIAQHAIGILPTLILELWPSLTLLASFATFVVWNGGVVMGDKSNHIATIHLPQVLYLFPFIIFFSWPTLLPLVSDPSTVVSRLPRRATVLMFTLISLLVVYVNTVVHPFLLADNRHYTFYVVRLLILRHRAVKYLTVPVYLLCGWLSLYALGGTAKPRRGSTVATLKGATEPDTVPVSFVLVWLLSTALSLVTAPLIEPRYFIIPWLIWRLNVPEVLPRQPAVQSIDSTNNPNGSIHKTSDSLKLDVSQSNTRELLTTLAQYSPHIELVWYSIINLATCWMFLYKPFRWPQEPGNAQRFMW